MVARTGPDRLAILNADGTFQNPRVLEQLRIALADVGLPASLIVGSVTTGAPGTDAVVELDDGVLTFIIPRGNPGLNGADGQDGDDGADGAIGHKGDTGDTGPRGAGGIPVWYRAAGWDARPSTTGDEYCLFGSWRIPSGESMTEQDLIDAPEPPWIDGDSWDPHPLSLFYDTLD